MEILKKVTCFVRGPAGAIALFRHPSGGVQIPAGTVEPGEAVEDAAVREATEETGLRNIVLVRPLGAERECLEDDERVVLRSARVTARPIPGSLNWAVLPRGIRVRYLREEGGFTHVSYQEWNDDAPSKYVTYEIRGWIPSGALGTAQERFFFELTSNDQIGKETWTVQTDGHDFEVFWGTQRGLERVVEAQRRWLQRLEPRGG